MQIDSYKFGEIVIDGTTYGSDVIIAAGTVRPNWRRKQGHLLSAEDLEAVIAARPSVLVIGCGASAMMKAPEETRQALRERNIQSEALDTHKAVQRFNQLSAEGANVAAALHLTC
ncbi:MAG TPA: Mth938-like domain-containing protein [Sedimentisphaerales bacterium]|nr:Mth938-like domain-containing protein [Sedimentisphaerales bacterium]